MFQLKLQQALGNKDDNTQLRLSAALTGKTVMTLLPTSGAKPCICRSLSLPFTNAN